MFEELSDNWDSYGAASVPRVLCKFADAFNQALIQEGIADYFEWYPIGRGVSFTAKVDNREFYMELRDPNLEEFLCLLVEKLPDEEKTLELTTNQTGVRFFIQWVMKV